MLLENRDKQYNGLLVYFMICSGETWIPHLHQLLSLIIDAIASTVPMYYISGGSADWQTSMTPISDIGRESMNLSLPGSYLDTAARVCQSIALAPLINHSLSLLTFMMALSSLVCRCTVILQLPSAVYVPPIQPQ